MYIYKWSNMHLIQVSSRIVLWSILNKHFETTLNDCLNSTIKRSVRLIAIYLVVGFNCVRDKQISGYIRWIGFHSKWTSYNVQCQQGWPLKGHCNGEKKISKNLSLFFSLTCLQCGKAYTYIKWIYYSDALSIVQ